MNIIDVVILLLLGLSFVQGYRRGVLKEGVMLIGTIVVYFLAFLLKGKVGLFLCTILPFFSFDGLVSLNILIYQLIAFVFIAGILFTIFGFVLKLTGILQKIVDVSIILTIPSKVLGGIVGLIEGYIIIFVLLCILSIPLKDQAIFNTSSFNRMIVTSSPILSSSLGNIPNMIIDVYDMSVHKEDSTKQMNEKLIKMYLDYHIINQEELYKIIDTGKLE